MMRLQSKHWGLIASYLTSVGFLIGGLEHWGDITPLFVAGLIGQTAALLTAIYAGAPPNPHARHNRRRADYRP